MLLLGVILSQRGGVVCSNHLDMTFALTASCVHLTDVVLWGREGLVHPSLPPSLPPSPPPSLTHLLSQKRSMGEGPAPWGMLSILGSPLGSNLVGSGLGGTGGIGSGLVCCCVGGGGGDVELIEVSCEM